MNDVRRPSLFDNHIKGVASPHQRSVKFANDERLGDCGRRDADLFGLACGTPPNSPEFNIRGLVEACVSPRRAAQHQCLGAPTPGLFHRCRQIKPRSTALPDRWRSSLPYQSPNDLDPIGSTGDDVPIAIPHIPAFFGPTGCDLKPMAPTADAPVGSTSPRRDAGGRLAERHTIDPSRTFSSGAMVG